MRTAFAEFLLFVAAIALMAGVALICAVAEAAMDGRPHIIPTPADAPVWAEGWSAPPQFCPAPMPVCSGDGCKRRSKA